MATTSPIAGEPQHVAMPVAEAEQVPQTTTVPPHSHTIPPSNDASDTSLSSANEKDTAASSSPSPSRSGNDASSAEKGVAIPPSAQPQRTKTQTALIMFALCLSVFLAALDSTIITTAVPVIAEDFHTSEGYTWIGSAFLLANAVSVSLWGKYSDIWGRKPVLQIATAVFFVGSLICALAINLGMLLVGRTIQGLAAGGLLVLANICVGDMFSVRDRGPYYGLIGMTWALACSIGPVLGGVFSTKVTWRWCFYINLPLSGLCFAIVFFFMNLRTARVGVREGLKRVDWLGSVTLLGGVLLLLLGLDFGGVRYPWSSAGPICLIIFGVLLLATFVFVEWRVAAHPVMPLRLFAHRSNVASLAVCFFHATCFMAAAYYLPLYFQGARGSSPLLSGVYILPFVVTMSAVSAVTGIIIKKTGQYLPAIRFGVLVALLGFGLYIDFDRTSSWAKIIIFQMIAGLGIGPNFQSPLIALQSNIQPRDIATATSTFALARTLGMSVSVVIGGVVFQNGMIRQAADLSRQLGPQLAGSLSGAEAVASTGFIDTLPEAQKVVAQDAIASALRDMWYLYVALAACAVLSSIFIKRHVLSKVHEGENGARAEKEEAARRERVGDEEVQRSQAAGGAAGEKGAV